MEETTTEETVVEPDDQRTDETVEPTEEEPETFPREYVERLREESAKYRTRAQRTDDLAKRLHVALVAAKGRLADPTDLAFDETHLDDDAALDAAIDQLLAAKPHLATRRPASVDVGQGRARSRPASTWRACSALGRCDMATRNADLLADTAATLLNQIKEASEQHTHPASLKALAEALALVAGSDPHPPKPRSVMAL